MNEPVHPQQQHTESSERYKNLIVLLTVFTTVLAAVLAALQADANIREGVASRDSQYLAILASGELHRAGLESNYEFSVLGDYLQNLQEGTVLEITAIEQETAGDEEAAQASREIAALSQARTSIGEKFSILYTDSRYAPQNDSDAKDSEDQSQARLFQCLCQAKQEKRYGNDRQRRHIEISFAAPVVIVIRSFILFFNDLI